MRKRFVDLMMKIAGPLLVGVQVASVPFPADGAERTQAMRKLPSVEIISGLDKKQEITLRKDGGFAQAELRAIKLKILSDNKDRSGEAMIFVVYEHGTGLYWWGFQWIIASYGRDLILRYMDDHNIMSRFMDEHKFYLLRNRIMGFRVFWSRILISECGGRQPSSDEAVRSALASFKPKLDDYGVPIQKEVELRESLGIHFCHKGESALASLDDIPHITDANRRKSKWIITLEGPNEHAAPGGSVKDKAVLTLGEDYAVQEAEVNGKRVFPRDRR